MSEFEPSGVAEDANGLPPAPLLLRQAREAAGLHIAALAAALKVPVKKLEALEAGRYDELPDMTFARALAASACRQLKVDPARVLAQIPGMVQTSLGSEKPSINEPFKSGDEMASAAAAAWLSRPVLWIVGLLLLAALAVALLPQGWVGRLQGGAAPETMPALTTPAGLMEPLASTPPDDAPPENALPLAADGEAVQAAASGTVADPAAAPAVATEPPAVAAPAATEPGAAVAANGLLSIRAVSESWIEVVNGSGAQVVQRVLKPGEALDFSTAPPYSVVLGRADAVQVTVRGQPFDVMPYARNSVARFEVK
jgi:cytoskeleton protein RodZ